MKDYNLNIPIVAEGVKWYEQYPKLPASKFTLQNSARYLREPEYFYFKNGGLISNPYMREASSKLRILGYSLTVPVPAAFEYVAIMFENIETFKVHWFHYLKYYE